VRGRFSEEELTVWLVNTGDRAEVAYRFVEEARSSLPVLLDESGEHYRAVPRGAGFAPFPVNVLIDKRGVIRGVYGQYDAAAMEPVIEALIAE
jgi:hypothetical protein